MLLFALRKVELRRINIKLASGLGVENIDILLEVMWVHLLHTEDPVFTAENRLDINFFRDEALGDEIVDPVLEIVILDDWKVSKWIPLADVSWDRFCLADFFGDGLVGANFYPKVVEISRLVESSVRLSFLALSLLSRFTCCLATVRIVVEDIG